jgi:hypothetical protein
MLAGSSEHTMGHWLAQSAMLTAIQAQSMRGQCWWSAVDCSTGRSDSKHAAVVSKVLMGPCPDVLTVRQMLLLLRITNSSR